MIEKKRYTKVDFAEIQSVECPCGISRRAFITESDGRASFHRVEIHATSRKHYHKKHFEIYYILEGEGLIEVDDEQIPVAPGSSVFIQEFCRHRAIGPLKIINISVPAFDSTDEWSDDDKTS